MWDPQYLNKRIGLHGLLRRQPRWCSYLSLSIVRLRTKSHGVSLMKLVPQRKQCIWASTVYYGDSFTFVYVDIRASLEKHLWASSVCYGDRFTFVYAHVRTSQETQACTACYVDSVTYVDDVRTWQETSLWTSTVCYGNSFTSVYVHVRTSQGKQLLASTPVTEIALLLYMLMFVEINDRRGSATLIMRHHSIRRSWH
jgi:hypothetical protein